MSARHNWRVAAAAVALVALTACGGDQAAEPAEAAAESEASPAGGGEQSGPIGVDFPRADSDFWNSYAKYVPQYADELGADLMAPTNSENDVAKLVANTQALVSQGAKAIIMAPQDTAAIASTLNQLADKEIPVVSVDTRPDQANAYMVVRADNRAYGEQACMYLGEQLKGKGKVVMLMGSLSSVNGRDRSEAFNECMEKEFPDITVFAEPTEWDGAKASAALETRLTQHPDIGGIYMQAGGVFLAPTLQVLRSKDLLVPRGEDGHVTIVSNDGIPEELGAIREGHIDATVSQPADLYARYAIFYAQAALAGETFEPGPTDHDSTIVEVRDGLLEDQLPAPLVTADNVDDPELWGNQVGE